MVRSILAGLTNYENQPYRELVKDYFKLIKDVKLWKKEHQKTLQKVKNLSNPGKFMRYIQIGNGITLFYDKLLELKNYKKGVETGKILSNEVDAIYSIYEQARRYEEELGEETHNHLGEFFGNVGINYGSNEANIIEQLLNDTRDTCASMYDLSNMVAVLKNKVVTKRNFLLENQWVIGIGTIVIGGIILFLILPNSKPPTTNEIYNVNSTNQSGGITAHTVVNNEVNIYPEKPTPPLKDNLREILNSINPKIIPYFLKGNQTICVCISQGKLNKLQEIKNVEVQLYSPLGARIIPQSGPELFPS